MIWKQKEIVLLPTEGKSPIVKTIGKKEFLFNSDNFEKFASDDYCHLYIIDDSEIKEDELPCWCINKNRDTVYQVQTLKGSINWNKIIASTDTICIRDSGWDASKDDYLPRIPQSFVEHFITEFNKGNVITNVMIEYESCKQPESCNNSLSKKCICPKGIKINPKDNTINIKPIKDTFSREEVETLLHSLYSFCTTDCSYDGVEFDNWLSKNL
jgi:hypothetical protein